MIFEYRENGSGRTLTTRAISSVGKERKKEIGNKKEQSGQGSVVGHPEMVSDCAWHSRERKRERNEERERKKVLVTLRRCCRMVGWAISMVASWKGRIVAW